MSVFLERVIMIQAEDEGQNGRTYNPHGFWRPNAGEGPGENNVWIRRYRRGKINHRRVESARLFWHLGLPWRPSEFCHPSTI